METEGREEYGGESLRSWRPDGRNWRWSHPGFSAMVKGAGSQVAGRRPGRVSWLGEVVGEVAQARDAGAWSQNRAPACAEVASAPTAAQG